MPTVPPLRRAPRGHLIVCGDTPLAFRLADQLSTSYMQDVTVVLPSKDRNHGPKIAKLARVRMHEAVDLGNDTFRDVHVKNARAVALVGDSEIANIHAALRVQELNPNVRLVIRMSNTTLGHRIRTLFADCAVLSDAGMAAPSFVAEALGEVNPSHVRVGGRTLYVARRSDRVSQVLCPLADTKRSEGNPILLPPEPDRANLVLAVATGTPRDPLSDYRARGRSIADLTGGLRVAVSRRLVQVGLVVLSLLILGSVLYGTVGGYDALSAIYLTLLALAGVANPDLSDRGVNKITLLTITLIGVALVPVVTAAVVDAIVRARLAGPLGRPRYPISGHVVVVGLGEVGVRVMSQLHDLGVPVVAVEKESDAAGVALARRLRVPTVFGDATREETLRTASVGTCQAVVTLTSDDIANLECGLSARALRDNVRVVLRLFDDELAEHVHNVFRIPVSRSVSSLAAPAFSAAMMERQVIGTLPVGRRVMLIADVPVTSGSTLDGSPLSTANRPHEARVIALVRRGGTTFDWQPQEGYLLVRGDRLIMLATRTGLGTVLEQSAPPPAARPASPGRGR